jgi:hypothetical protein
MSRSWSIVAGAVLFAVGAIGMAVWLWVKRRQLALAAAKAVPGQASAAAKAVPGQASAAAKAVPGQVSAAATEQASTVTNAITEQPRSAQ